MTLGVQPSTAWVNSLQNLTRLMQHHRCFHIIFLLSRSLTLWPSPISQFLPLPLIFSVTVPLRTDSQGVVVEISPYETHTTRLIFQHGVLSCGDFSWVTLAVVVFSLATCHLPDGDTHMLLFHSQLHTVIVTSHKKEHCFVARPLEMLYRLTTHAPTLPGACSGLHWAVPSAATLRLDSSSISSVFRWYYVPSGTCARQSKCSSHAQISSKNVTLGSWALSYQCKTMSQFF